MNTLSQGASRVYCNHPDQRSFKKSCSYIIKCFYETTRNRKQPSDPPLSYPFCSTEPPSLSLQPSASPTPYPSLPPTPFPSVSKKTITHRKMYAQALCTSQEKYQEKLTAKRKSENLHIYPRMLYLVQCFAYSRDKKNLSA